MTPWKTLSGHCKFCQVSIDQHYLPTLQLTLDGIVSRFESSVRLCELFKRFASGQARSHANENHFQYVSNSIEFH